MLESSTGEVVPHQPVAFMEKRPCGIIGIEMGWGWVALAGILLVAFLHERGQASAPQQPRILGTRAIGQFTAIAPTATYENTEEWEIVRGADSRIEKIVIHRRATVRGE